MVEKFHCLNQIWPWRSRSVATFTIGTSIKLFSTSGPNLVILAWMGSELWSGQAQNWVNSDFEVKFDLESQGQSPPKTIGILTKVFYIYGPNLVILADTGHELSRGQAHDWHTDGHTHRQTQATTIPEGQYWPRVKSSDYSIQIECQTKQDRRWNADKPSAAFDPYIPTWLTTSSANHRPANFWKSFFFFFFETLERNCEEWCNLMLNWCGSISNLKLPFSDSWSTNNHRYYLSVYYVLWECWYIFTVCHSDVATWFSVLPIYIDYWEG